MAFHLVIPAAGAGRRMGGPLPKQYQALLGEPVLVHTLRRFADLPLGYIVLVLADDDERGAALAQTVAFSGQLQIVSGGQERWHSVQNALLWLRSRVAPEDWVLVHDAVRPCVRKENLQVMLEWASSADNVIDGLSEHGAVLAVPVVDTLKQADETGRVLFTPPRDGLWQACTPQMFRVGALARALESAIDEGVAVTDECSAMERVGCSVQLLPCGRDNIKITYPDDLRLATQLLASERLSKNQI